MAGDRRLFGWTAERMLLGDIFDALNINTRATGMWKGKPPEFPLAARPTSDDGQRETAKSSVSVASLYSQFTGGH